VSFEDLPRGAREGIADDVVLWRADDAPAYNLAVVVDDDALARSAGLVLPGEPATLDSLLTAFEPQRLAREPAILSSRGPLQARG
jgi:hypothetical protein